MAPRFSPTRTPQFPYRSSYTTPGGGALYERGPRWGARTSTVPGAIGITRESFEEIDKLIRSLAQGTKEFDQVMDAATHLLAMTTKGFVQMKYRGPVGGAGQPWTIPVRRLTGETYRGWRVRRIKSGVWEVFNNERGAYAVEFGLSRYGQGVRRPVLKMSGIATLRFIQRTRFAERIMGDTFGNLRNNKGQFRSFAARMAGSSMLGVVGPQGRLP